ncbi:hypothetical protein KQX54_002062 [Cotesia glomerata]|uniref:Uncharacterized protein n=1 Tax=Cotesia glomerata TaxID=32391 RepID=A0AAV7HU75_COTGL|nr:hypothetical protein KQX54_002062 [Cotesia glomerata]
MIYYRKKAHRLTTRVNEMHINLERFPAPAGRAFEMDPNPRDRTRWQELQCHLLDLVILLDSRQRVDSDLWPPLLLDIFKSLRDKE